MWKSIIPGEQKTIMNPIREPQHIPGVVRLAALLAMRVFQLIIHEYRSGEEESFKRKYVQEWRTRFLKEYRIDLSPNDTLI